jgi:hypothetical protein
VSDRPDPEGIEVIGGFLHINDRTWVLHSAILVIRSRPTDGGEASEITVRPNSGGSGAPLWCDHPSERIIAAIQRAKAESKRK